MSAFKAEIFGHHKLTVTIREPELASFSSKRQQPYRAYRAEGNELDDTGKGKFANVRVYEYGYVGSTSGGLDWRSRRRPPNCLRRYPYNLAEGSRNPEG